MTILTKQQLLAHLDDIRNQVEKDGSFEGYINYTTYNNQLNKNEFMVNGVYRIVDSTGQDGVRAISSWSYGSVISHLSNSTISSFQKTPELELIEQKISECQKQLNELNAKRYEMTRKKL